MKKVLGVGVNDLERGQLGEGGNVHKFYSVWKDMLKRCYHEGYKKERPTYDGCTVCEEWKTLSNFKSWFDEHYIEGYQLDKDLINPKNKVYSPQTCAFVSGNLNKLFTDSAKNRGALPIGVSKCSRANTFVAYVNEYGKRVHLGTFDDVGSASEAYRNEKNRYVLEYVGSRNGYEDGRVIDAILNRFKRSP